MWQSIQNQEHWDPGHLHLSSPSGQRIHAERGKEIRDNYPQPAQSLAGGSLKNENVTCARQSFRRYTDISSKETNTGNSKYTVIS